MDRRLIAGHSPYERTVGFSRAVVAGEHVYVAGTAPIPADGSPPPEDAYSQMKLCLEIVAGALEQSGGSLGDVVRTRVYVTDPAHMEGVGRAHGEAFGEIRPANTTVVTALLDPAWKVEVEVDAILRRP